MIAIRLMCLAALYVSAAMQPDPGPPAKPDPAVAAFPTKAELQKKTVARMTSSPVLHVTASEEFQGQHYDAESWMTRTKSKGVLRKAGRVIFAMSILNGRVQEFAPWVEFKNGQNAKNVLVEYDAEGSEASLDWPRLISTDLACGPGAVGASWLVPSRPMIGEQMGTTSVPEEIAQVLEEPGDLQGVTIKGHDCYWMHAEIRIDDATQVVKDLYIDQTSYEPVRDSIVTFKHGAVAKSIETDYTLEHLQTEDGIDWRLDAARLVENIDRKR